MSYERNSVHFWILVRGTEIPRLCEQGYRPNVFLAIHGIRREESIHSCLHASAEDSTQNYNAPTYLDESTRMSNIRRTNNQVIHMSKGIVMLPDIKEGDGLNVTLMR